MESAKSLWAGRRFMCRTTGEVFTIPDDVRYRAFYNIGKGFIDIGDGWYCRFGGDIVELDKWGNQIGEE